MVEIQGKTRLFLLSFATLVIIVLVAYFMVFGNRQGEEFNFGYPPDILDEPCEDITLAPEQAFSEAVKELVNPNISKLEDIVDYFFSVNGIGKKAEKMKLIFRFVQKRIALEHQQVDEGITIKCPVNTILFGAGNTIEKVTLFASMAEAAGFDAVIVIVSSSQDETRSLFLVGLRIEEETLKELDEYFYFEYKEKKYLAFIPNSMDCDFSCNPGEIFVRGLEDFNHRLVLNEKNHFIEVGK